jgi:hypothetical protein
MPLVISGPLVPYLKAEWLGAIFSAIAYGIVIVLSGNCFHLLQKKRGIYSNRMRIILLIYITVMSLLSTLALILSINSLMLDINPRSSDRRILPFQLLVVTGIWGADGFMVSILYLRWEQRFAIQLQVWRCVILYQDVSKGLKLAIIILLSLLVFTSFGRLISISSLDLIQIAHEKFKHEDPVS